jgi:hypothetical protein
MRLTTMQENRDARDRDVRGDQREDENLPPGGRSQALVEKDQDGIKQETPPGSANTAKQPLFRQSTADFSAGASIVHPSP